MKIFLYSIIAACIITNFSFAQRSITIDGKPCGMHGNAATKQEYNQNLLKNRFTFPTEKNLDSTVTLDRLVSGGKDKDRFSQNSAVMIGAYVYDVKVGDVETCNCQTTDEKFRDTYIILTPSYRDTAPQRRLIVVVTPRTRATAALHKDDWSTENIKRIIKHRSIIVQGWLFYDFAHANDAFSYDPEDKIGAKNRRATAWEVHPVTYMELIDFSKQ